MERLATLLARRDDLRLTLLTNAEGPRIRIPGTREVACRRRGGVVWRNSFVAPWLARHRPDVFWAAETVAPLHLPVPLVATVHDLAAVLFPDTKPATLKLAYRFSIPRALGRAAAVIAVSKSTAADAAGRWGIDPARTRVIPLGIEPLFEPGDRESAAAAVVARWGLDSPYVLAVGSLEPRKGLDVLIDAVAECGDWQLVLAGRPGHKGEQLRRRAVRAGAHVVGGV